MSARDGRSGHLRIDSVHQDDEDGGKGVYHINVVGVTQPCRPNGVEISRLGPMCD
ncbi:MAG: hypothetical protein LC647_14535 [Beggiatoa sp.]|nr:hypothetical protein [Beggiatoa sp.]